MTSTNRIANRVIIALVGVLLLAAGAWVLLRAYPAVAPALTLPDPGLPDATFLWSTAAIAALLVVASLGWILTRGRGRVATLAESRDDAGVTTVDSRVVADLVADALAPQLDVVGVHANAFQVKRRPALELRVTARTGADLPRLIDAMTVVIDDLDVVIETTTPVLLHVASGVRASLAHNTRIA